MMRNYAPEELGRYGDANDSYRRALQLRKCRLDGLTAAKQL